MKRKWTLFWFWTGDFKAVERYLNEQAEKGWELEKARVFAKWKRTERSDLTYCVDLANPKDDENDRKVYADFCAEGGWTQVGFVNEMYIFKSMPGKEVTPIQTDPEMEWKNYKKYFLKRILLWAVLVIVNAMINAANWGFSGNWERLPAEMQILFIIVGLWLLWRVADFIRAMVSNRDGRIAASPRWVMWTNRLMAVVAAIGMALALVIIVMLPFGAFPFKRY